MASLLGQFYSRIKGSQEDIASEGLAYILQRSPAARQALSKIIHFDSGLIFEDINYLTQNTGEKLERPDISGINVTGKEVVILEAKFWASLTDHQPIGYLSRLGENSTLIFVCPTLRVRPVFDELHMRLIKTGMNFRINKDKHSFILDGNKHLIVKTWQEILSTIRMQLVQNNERLLLSDIDQIIGLCETIDSNSFLPYQSEDFAPEVAKKINSLYDLTDKVIDELKKRKLANTVGLKATPQRQGYTRYFKIYNLGVALNIRFDFWESVADTPFWLCIKDSTGKRWVQNESFKVEIKHYANRNASIYYETYRRELFTPLFPLLDKTEDLVVNDLANQIIKMTSELASLPKTNTDPSQPNI